MKRTAAAAAILTALLAAPGPASADGHRDGYYHHHGAHFRHMHRHHADWRWRRAARIDAPTYYGQRYYGPEYDVDYGYAPAPRYAYPAYSGCYSGCGQVYSTCAAYSYGCRPAYSGCGYYGGGCGGWMTYSRCGGC
jgi:hypothetical protein